MNALPLFIIFSLILCQNEDGGWEKRSITEDDLYINSSFKEAFKSYNEKGNYDNYIPLTVYSQIISGTNYKVCFIDKGKEYPIIQEYIIYKPLPLDGDIYEVSEHNEYQSGKLISFKDEMFSLVENYLIKNYENSSDKINYVSYIISIENNETIFYISFAETKNGEHQYIVCQDKISKELYLYNQFK